jgi:hypothetical protein
MSLIGIAGQSKKALAVGLGVGLVGAFAIASILPSRAAPVQTDAVQKTAENPAKKPGGASPTPSPGTNATGITRVEKGPFKIEVVLNGVFEAQRMIEVSIRPKAWAMPLQVERAIELGRPVKKGDILVEFVRDKIDTRTPQSRTRSANWRSSRQKKSCRCSRRHCPSIWPPPRVPRVRPTKT